MRPLLPLLLHLALASAHATFQEIWIGSTDEQGYCVRLPPNNNPVTDVTSTDLRCNVDGLTGVANKCSVAAGEMVTVEMHQQPGVRICATQAISETHYGPVMAYMTKVDDAATADGSTGWFKVYADTWAPAAGASVGSSDDWGTTDLINCCGRVDVLIPADIPPGDYLLRAEVIALHVAQSEGGAQFYMSCYQLTVTGGGSASPALVDIPGVYAATDPGILIDIYESMTTYVEPGPTVFSAGMTKSAGATCSAGVEAGTTTGPLYSGGAGGATSPATTTGVTGKSAPSGMTTSTVPSTTSLPTTTTTSAAAAGCTASMYGQCGGQGFSGCTACGSGAVCSGVSPPYYSQCMAA